jgi:hypothetical protein
MRKLIRRVAMLFGAAAPVAVVAVYSGAAEVAASGCHTQACMSDARLKTNIRPL